MKAIRSFLKEGASLQEIQEKYGITRSTLYRVIDKCEALDKSGSPVGWTAAIPYKRSGEKKYNRTADPDSASSSSAKGYSGAFTQFVEKHENLAEWLSVQASKYKPRRSGGDYFIAIHKAFVRECISCGVGAYEYPLNQKTQGITGLKKWLVDKHRELRAERELRFSESNGSVRDIDPSDILEQIEADGHKLDIRLVIRERDAYGEPVEYEILRVWLICLIDVFSRCVLGYSLALGHNYDRIDLLTAIYRALSPHARPPVCIPDTSYRDEGGFPSETIGAWQTWSILKVDNAWAHKAKHVIEILNDRLGCVVEFGKPHTPNDRPIIERFFLYLVQNFSHRVIGTTGSESKDEIISRLSPKSKKPLRMLLSLEELESAIDIVISDYNGRPHSAIQGHTPLDLYLMRMKARALPPNTLPVRFQNESAFTRIREIKTVQTNAKHGGAFINFAYQKYRNADVLRSNSAGRRMIIEYSRRDVSTINLLDESGSFIGVLTPPPPYSTIAHSYKLQTEISKAVKDGQFRFSANETFVEAVRRFQLRGNKVTRESATNIYKNTGMVSAGSQTLEVDNSVEPEPNKDRVKLSKVFTF
ncbi:integrase core domain protein [Pseudomonas fluorescens]|uniref:Integrase core domain protein n=1 Tax=Pseudomonas fluorescens TaxID=294 RepID=A0A0P8X1N6_PSEFL|nr:integrase [Pseudomonas fluorescens]KPU59464.1 integrase core domain protein [Pseudomonas fluorescens]